MVQRNFQGLKFEIWKPSTDFAQGDATRRGIIRCLTHSLGDFSTHLPDTLRGCGDCESGLASQYTVTEQVRQLAAKEHHTERAALHDLRFTTRFREQVRVAGTGGEDQAARQQRSPGDFYVAFMIANVAFLAFLPVAGASYTYFEKRFLAYRRPYLRAPIGERAAAVAN